MQTTPQHAAREADESIPRLDPAADAYLWRLVKEQNHFLDALGEATSVLSSSSLGRVVAVQNRLTQEFLDAQRAIIRRRAETDAAIAEIERNGAPTGASVPLAPPVTGASVTFGAAESPGVVSAFDPPQGWPLSSAPPSLDLAELARLVDEAFEPGDVDGTTMRRQLRGLLDEWWRSENQENRAAIDDAQARAAVRAHRAPAPVGLLAPPAFSHHVTPRPQLAPEQHHTAVVAGSTVGCLPPLVAALEAVEHQDLDEVLGSLLASLDADDAPVADHSAVAGPVIHPHVPPATAALLEPVPVLPPLPSQMSHSLTDDSAAPQEAFERFWGGFAHSGPGRRDWMFTQFLLPAVAVISVLAFVLAVVG